ncbi:MAG: acyltransferase [Casimicrobiaceae bacterium]
MRFNNIQVLRFFAAASVALYHSHYYVGALLWKTPMTRAFDFHFAWGVELFFAISGFVVSYSLTKSTPGRFLALRLMRIYPAFWLAAFVVIAGRFALGGHPFTSGLLPALTLMPVGGADYPLGGVEWSLVYEVFFYTLLALIALVPVRFAREWAMVVWLAAIAAMALYGPVPATSFVPTFGTIAFSAFNLPFIAGVLGYSLFRGVDRLPLAVLVATVPIALLAADGEISTELQLAFQAVGFAALVLSAAEISRRWDVAATNPLVKLGDMSYGLYLVHVPVILAVLARNRFGPADANEAFLTCASTALVVGCGYGWIEISLYRRNKAWLDRRWPRRDGGTVTAGR